MYVDDLLIIGESQIQIKELKSEMKSQFQMAYLGSLAYFLRMEFLYNEDEMILH